MIDERTTVRARCGAERTLIYRREVNPIGSRALSHDSVFIPEESVAEPGLDHSMSQENISDKVKNLQVGFAMHTQWLNRCLLCLCVTVCQRFHVRRTEAVSTRHQVWPEASFCEEE